MPDDIWFAWDNGRSDVRTDKRVLSDEWDDHDRVHQYALDVTQTFGGYPMVVDANWVDVGRGSVAPRSRPLCRGVDVDLRRYPTLGKGRSGDAVRAAQCLLRRQGLLKAPLTGRYDARTAAAVGKAQRRLDLPETGRLTRSTWTGLLARGWQPLLKVGDTGAAVLRLQRALTAALGRPVRIDGVVDKGTARAVAAYQRKTRTAGDRRGHPRGVGRPRPEPGPGPAQAARPSRARLTTSSAGLAAVAGAPIRRVPVWSTR